MKRKITLLVLTLIVVMLTTFVLFACNSNADGKYYLYDGNTKYEDSWIEIKGKNWTSAEGVSGKVSIDGDNITLTADSGETLTGTVKDGVLMLGEAPLVVVYAKDGVDPSKVGNSNVDNRAKVVAIQGGTVDGLNVNLDVGSEVADVDLSGMLQVSNNSSWQLYLDKLGQTIVPTKYATNLVEGDNIYYIVVNSEDGSVNRTYTLNVHKQYYTNVYLKVNDQVVKTIENVLSHTNVELNAPSEIKGYNLTWGSSTYYVTERNKTIEPSSVTAKTYTVTLDAGEGTLSGNATHTISYNSEYTLPVAEREGYTFIGWAGDGVTVTDSYGVSTENFLFDKDITYTATYRPNKVELTVVSQHLNLGSVDKVTGEKDYGSTVTIKANPFDKVYFDGWYTSSQEGAIKLSDQPTYTFTVGENTTFVARFICYTVTTQAFDDNAGTFDEYRGQKMTIGEQKTLNATANPGYIWLGWFDGTTKVTDSLTYVFTMERESKTFTARWEKCTSHTLVECVCTKCNAASHTGDIVGGQCNSCGETVYTRNDSYITFGSYPQTRVTDYTTTQALKEMAGSMPSSSYGYNWTSYGYYQSGSVSDYMWYIDLEYNGEKYRGVYFTSYRLTNITYTDVSNVISYTYQDDAGYSLNNAYWFKYEPIKWRIMSEADGKAVILSELILDSQEFYHSRDTRTEDGNTVYANNWEYSNIRKWLNDNFYNVAFTELQKAIIVATELDNKTTGKNGTENTYTSCQNNTTDNVYLLAYQELANNALLEEVRSKYTTDYSQVQGADGYYSAHVASDEGRGHWWLRTACPDNGTKTSNLHRVSGVWTEMEVACTYVGVAPAITIQL
ncbi:MAG: cadherin-like beta sandwich domain-containing protein [Clostridia bacterium]|nr:cadherin-like beta sandwich domain-containing protein [Clostridia bacterium]